MKLQVDQGERKAQCEAGVYRSDVLECRWRIRLFFFSVCSLNSLSFASSLTLNLSTVAHIIAHAPAWCSVRFGSEIRTVWLAVVAPILFFFSLSVCVCAHSTSSLCPFVRLALFSLSLAPETV
jgi:hypothetical protein